MSFEILIPIVGNANQIWVIETLIFNAVKIRESNSNIKIISISYENFELK